MAESDQINGAPQSGTPQPPPEKAVSENPVQEVVKAVRNLPARKARKRKRMELGQAMRACGLDEHAVARMYLRVLRSLHESEPKLGAKVLFLKECVRLLDSKRAGKGSRSRNEFRAVKLIHKVPRPVRDGEQEKAKI
jgi:hypothetical protein